MTDATAHRPESQESRDHFNNMIAIAVALISAFMAVSKVKDDNIVQAMQKAQSEVLDNWNVYQARQQRRVLGEYMLSQTKAVTPEPYPERVAKALAEWQKAVDDSKTRADQAAAKAKAAQEAYDSLNDRDDLFDLSDAMLSVSLALFAITALIRIRWLFGLATGLGLLGMFFGSAGFGGWTQFHPNWLVALLS
ncbi:DUF4337 family protein [Prosthecodimorpha hirschii]|uniref:DUF4337 family protein n=1 Tax=Prosthecodimorpha hirschii TaxID=665126 RepID=UPI0015E3B6ED|nr:DUF4337 family protein [Prosthecomicrobium hirschii]